MHGKTASADLFMFPLRWQAKRSDRAKLRGFDAHKVNQELVDFVNSETDVIAFPPMGDWGVKSVQQVGSGSRRSRPAC